MFEFERRRLFVWCTGTDDGRFGRPWWKFTNGPWSGSGEIIRVVLGVELRVGVLVKGSGICILEW